MTGAGQRSAVEIDFAPFLETARLLYEGPWVAERYVAIRDFIERQPKALHPVTAQHHRRRGAAQRDRHLRRVLPPEGAARARPRRSGTRSTCW